jgi:hypothetical protein
MDWSATDIMARAILLFRFGAVPGAGGKK